MRVAPPVAGSHLLRVCSLLAWLLLGGGLVNSRAVDNANLLRNGGFEKTEVPDDNLWDGVDADGYLAGFKYGARAVTASGDFATLAMPPSVAFVDLNGDGKPDLVTADPTGYFRFYPNVGTAKAPRFTTGELIPIFLSTDTRPFQKRPANDPIRAGRYCPRFALADWRHSGVLDLLVGNYYGETFFLPNGGTARQPVFRQPANGVDSLRFFTSERTPFWANLLSPVAADWTGNGRLDLVTGEGTYSANAIHLLENIGSGSNPKFSDAKHFRIAYGDGREQLMPAVADFDGDGSPDLIVADRSGEVGVYLNPGRTKPEAELRRVSTLTFGGVSKLPGLCSLYAADFNGDGLFDLLIGQPSGRIAVALNTGTKGQPSFGPPQDIKGEDRLGRNVKLPASWNVNTESGEGNALAYLTVVDATEDPASQPTEGTRCLKAGYWSQPGQTFTIPPEGIQSTSKHFYFSCPSVTLELNKPYQVSFKVKNLGMKDLRYSFVSRSMLKSSLVKVERGERGEMKNRSALAEEGINENHTFDAGSNWTTITGSLNLHLNNAALKDEKEVTGSFKVEFTATNQSSVAYFDDFSLLKQGK